MAVKKLKKLTEEQSHHFTLIGQRLRELRIMENLTMNEVEILCELPGHSIRNLEHAMGGSANTLIGVVSFFVKKGYNVKWMLYLDNSNQLKKEEQYLFVDINKEKLVEIAEEINTSSQNILNILNTNF